MQFLFEEGVKLIFFSLFPQMFRLRVLHHAQSIDIPLDEQLDPTQFRIAASYRQLAVASQCRITVYNLAPLLLDEHFSHSYETVLTPSPILALTSTIDRIIYVYQSADHPEQLKICSLPGKEQYFLIQSLKVGDSVHLCSLDDGTIYVAHDCQVYSLTGQRWSFDSKIKKLAGGKEHALVLLADGRLFAWGNGLHGALGFGDLEPSSQPTHIEAMHSQVSDIAAGGWHSLGKNRFLST